MFNYGPGKECTVTTQSREIEMRPGYGSGGDTGAIVILLALGSQVSLPIPITFFLLTRFPENESKNK